MGHTMSTGIKILRLVVPYYSYLKYVCILAGYCEQAADNCICWSFNGIRFFANLVMKERFHSLKTRAYCGHQYFFIFRF